jgi:hypothetical protein
VNDERLRALPVPVGHPYPLGKSGETIVLFDGLLGGVGERDRPGRVELELGPSPSLQWWAEVEPAEHIPFESDVTLELHRPGGIVHLAAHRQSSDKGWVDGGVITVPANQMIVKVSLLWLDLPANLGTRPFNAGGWAYSGRWQEVMAGWSITLDERSDHAEVYGLAKRNHAHAVTHVMEIARESGDAFTVEEATNLVENLRVAFSFACGRWVAALLPVGFNSLGKVVWEQWFTPITAPISSELRWLPDVPSHELTAFMTSAIASLDDPARLRTTRFQMQLGVEAIGAKGFVEPRLMAAFMAIENLCWVTLVLTGTMPESEYNDHKKWSGAKRLRTLLQAAKIPLSIDASALPSLAKFARDKVLDGPAAVVKVRNMLVHPRRPQEELYDHDELIVDAWVLSRRYVTLLVLFSIGYVGHVQNDFPAQGWPLREKVPWA